MKRAIRSVTHLVLTPARESVSNLHCDADPENLCAKACSFSLSIACGFRTARGMSPSAALSNPVVTCGLVESLPKMLLLFQSSSKLGRTSFSNQSFCSWSSTPFAWLREALPKGLLA